MTNPAMLTELFFPMPLLMKVTALLLTTAGAAWLLRRASAAVRHLVWTAGVLGALVLPLLSAGLPAWQTPVPAWAPFEAVPAADIPADSEARPVRTARSDRPDHGEVTAAGRTPEPAAPSAVRTTTKTTTGTSAAAAPVGSWVSRIAWMPLLGALWLAGTLIGLVRLGLAYGALYRWQRGLPRVADNRVAALAEAMGIRRPVVVRRGEPGTMPMTWGVVRAQLALPPEAEAWPEDTRHQVLVHELAHIRRHDHLTQLLAGVACAVYWFHPLAWMAAAALRREREIASDDWVVQSGARPDAYAHRLIDLARGMHAVGSAQVATAMARRSQLTGRVQSLLAPTVRRGRPGWRRGAPVAALVGLLLVPLAAWELAPAPLLEAAAREGGRRGTVVESDDSGTVTVQWYDGDYKVDLKGKGSIRFNDAETDVLEISRGGYFDVKEWDGDTVRRLRIEPQGGGLQRTYWKAGQEHAYDDDAAEWFAALLPEIFRRTGWGAAERVGRMLEQGGVDRVLGEVDRMTSDHVTRVYLVELIDRAELDAGQSRRVLDRAGEMDSDYEKAELLVHAAHRGALSGNLAATYAEYTRKFGSDYERRKALTALVRYMDLDAAATEAILASAAGMDSDYETAEFLSDLARKHELDSGECLAYLDTVSNMDSDYETRRALTALLDTGRLDEAGLEKLFETVMRNMDSGYETAEVLTDAARRYDLAGGARDAYVRAARNIDSGYERERALNAVGGTIQ